MKLNLCALSTKYGVTACKKLMRLILLIFFFLCLLLIFFLLNFPLYFLYISLGTMAKVGGGLEALVTFGEETLN